MSFIKKIAKNITPIKKIIETRDYYRSEYNKACYKISHLEDECNNLRKNNEILSNENNIIAGEKNTLNDKIIKLNTNLEIMYKVNNKDFDSSKFWNSHYVSGGTSGTGSYNRLAEFKAEIINNFVKINEIKTVIEYGCGDGNQLKYMNHPFFVGVDASEYIINENKKMFSYDMSKEFYSLNERDCYINRKFDLSLSIDVIYHLIQDDIYEKYMDDLFYTAEKYIIIYSSNHEEITKWIEYKHRNFFKYIQEKQSNWKLIEFIPNRYPYIIGEESETSASDFYIFKKI